MTQILQMGKEDCEHEWVMLEFAVEGPHKERCLKCGAEEREPLRLIVASGANEL